MKRKAVFTRYGEISYTHAEFNCFLEDFTGDLNAKKPFFFSSDDWRLTEPELLHEIREVEIPDWIPEELQAAYFKPGELGKALRIISWKPEKKFHKSIIKYLKENKRLTRKQIEAVIGWNDYPWKMKRKQTI